MGKKGPKRGSRAFWHRRRAGRVVPRMRFWREADKPGLLGFCGYKAGMTHVVLVEDAEGPLKGQEVTKPVTILQVPPLFVYAVVALERTPFGLRPLVQANAAGAPKEASRALSPAKKNAGSLDAVEKALDRTAVVRVIALTQPAKIGLKKTPEVVELGVGGKTAREQFEYAKGVFGKDVRAADVLVDGMRVDVVGVTKGKGWQGVVKRFGVALNPRKATGARRHGGSIGPETQAKVTYTIPRAGQMGFHRRTDRNKRILFLSNDAASVTPAGGFTNAKKLAGDFVVLEGSVPGPAQRFVRLNPSNAPGRAEKPDVRYIHQ